jgi:hypothetical protein
MTTKISKKVTVNIPTPELEKQHDVIESGASQTLTDFYDWLCEKGFVIAEYVKFEEYRDKQLVPTFVRPEKLFADFFDIDLDKIESERRAILEVLRES